MSQRVLASTFAGWRAPHCTSKSTLVRAFPSELAEICRDSPRPSLHDSDPVRLRGTTRIRCAESRSVSHAEMQVTLTHATLPASAS
eukprot:2456860-Rhodomonas_salina.1